MKTWPRFIWGAVLSWGCASALAGIPQLALTVDGARAPAGGGGASSIPIITPDGRYVLFASAANNLVLNAATNPIPLLVPPKMNVYLRDRLSGTTALVSANLSGLGGGNGDSWPAGVSTNGRYALFESSASDLAFGDTNGATDVFVRDLAVGVTLLASVNTNGVAGNGASRDAVMTPDGRYVAFASDASDLAPDDTNRIADVFVRDVRAGLTVLASVSAISTNATNPAGGSESPDITPDGRCVAFYSTATGLVPDAGAGGDIYARDLVSDNTIWVSTGARAAVKSVMGATQAISFNHALSADGRYVAYESSPVPALATAGPISAGLILRYDLQTGLTDVVSTNAWVTTGASQDIANLAMTPDGRFIAFIANTNGTTGANTCVLVWDAQTGASLLASGAPDHSVPPGSTCDWPALDPSGRYAAFLSTASNLTTNALSGPYHLFLRDLQEGATTLVDADAEGAGAGVSAASAPRLAAGPVIAFESFDSDLAGTNGNPTYDVFVRDLSTQTTELISAHDPSLPSLTPNGNSLPGSWTLSADNRYLAFSSEADNLVSNDTNGCRDIFVRDLLLNATRLASVSTNSSSADGASSEPTLSAEGRFVAFTSAADNLVANDTNRLADVFVSDLQSGTTTLVSVGVDGISPGNGASWSPALSADGRFVLFHSLAQNLAPGPYPFGSLGTENLFLRDRNNQVTYALTTAGLLSAAMTRDGHYVVFVGTAIGSTSNNKLYVWDSWAARRVYTNATLLSATSVGLSPNGQRLACINGAVSAMLYGVDWVSNRVWTIDSGITPAPRPGLRFSGDGRFLAYAARTNSASPNQVYLYDCQTANRILASQDYTNAGPANGNSDAPDLSYDGSFLAFRSTAPDLVPGAANGPPEIFLYAITNHLVLLASSSRFGAGTADNQCLAPAFDGDGNVLLFGSWASDLAPDDFNNGADLFLLSLYSNAVIPLFSLQVVVGAPGQGSTLAWPAMSGKTYRVQYKDSLTGSVWQDLPVSPTIIGSQGYVSDPSAPGPQRFYRVSVF